MQPPALAQPLAARPKLRRQRLGIRLPQPVLRRLREFVAALGATESDIITRWVTERLDAGGVRITESSQPSAIDHLVKAINADRAARAAEHRELLDAVELLSEAFGRFVGLWMVTGPGLPTDPAQRAAHTRASEARYEGFARWVIDHFQRGHRFVPAAAPAEPPRVPRSQGGPPTGGGGGTL